MEQRTLTINGQEITFSGLIFSKFFGILTLTVMFIILIASIKYILS
jgi:hypothetical protein